MVVTNSSKDVLRGVCYKKRLLVYPILILSVLLVSMKLAVAFSYEAPGQLVSGSGTGREDYNVYMVKMDFPLTEIPAYVNSQVWGVGGNNGPNGSQCDILNYSYPWRDNYCETRSWDMPLCPAGKGHQGVDIRPSGCSKNIYKVVAVESGTITRIGSYTVYHEGNSGIEHRYMHMESLKVELGDDVIMGQELGMVSNKMGGTPTTIHLHYDMRSDGTFIPPYWSLVKSYQLLIDSGRPDWWSLWDWFTSWGWSGR